MSAANPLVPRAPLTLNSSAPAYSRLAALLSSEPSKEATKWKAHLPNHIGALSTNCKGESNIQSFTHDELFEVSPSILNILLENVRTNQSSTDLNNPDGYSYISYLEDLWRHFSEQCQQNQMTMYMIIK